MRYCCRKKAFVFCFKKVTFFLRETLLIQQICSYFYVTLYIILLALINDDRIDFVQQNVFPRNFSSREIPSPFFSNSTRLYLILSHISVTVISRHPFSKRNQGVLYRTLEWSRTITRG